MQRLLDIGRVLGRDLLWSSRRRRELSGPPLFLLNPSPSLPARQQHSLSSHLSPRRINPSRRHRGREEEAEEGESGGGKEEEERRILQACLDQFQEDLSLGVVACTGLLIARLLVWRPLWRSMIPCCYLLALN